MDFRPNAAAQRVFNRSMRTPRRHFASAMAFVAIAMVASSVSARSDRPMLAAQRAAPSPEQSIVWSLQVEPSTRITLERRRTFRMTLYAQNNGSTVVNTRRDAIEWYINGQRSPQFAALFASRVRSEQWAALRPRASVRDVQAAGELMPSAGRYVFSIRLDGRELAQRTITVR